MSSAAIEIDAWRLVDNPPGAEEVAAFGDFERRLAILREGYDAMVEHVAEISAVLKRHGILERRERRKPLDSLGRFGVAIDLGCEVATMLARKIVEIFVVEKTTRDYWRSAEVGRDLKTGYFEIYTYRESEHLRSTPRETLIMMFGNDTERGMTIKEAFDIMLNETPEQRSDVRNR